MYWVALIVAPLVVMICEAATAPLKTKLLPALVIVALVWTLTVDVPVVKGHRKLAFAVALAPVCDSVLDAPLTTSVTVPVAGTTLTFATGAVSVLAPFTVTVAVGAPVNTMLLAAAPVEIVVVELNVMVTAAVDPKMKLLSVVVIDAVVVVMRLVPLSAPATDSPKPGDVSVDDATVSPAPAADDT